MQCRRPLAGTVSNTDLEVRRIVVKDHQDQGWPRLWPGLMLSGKWHQTISPAVGSPHHWGVMQFPLRTNSNVPSACYLGGVLLI
jgi:hypothetical protein